MITYRYAKSQDFLVKWTLWPSGIEELSEISEMVTVKNVTIQMDSYSDFLKGILNIRIEWLKQIHKGVSVSQYEHVKHLEVLNSVIK